jgi:DNA-binding CsgD family transcriptional regulator
MMIVISPSPANERVPLQSDRATEVMRSIGTERYSKACFELFAQPLEVDHWALFRYSGSNAVHCVATASRSYAVAAKENINRFVGRHYSVDPSLSALKGRPLQTAYVVKMEIDDIRDRQYRHCFGQTHVQERLSYFYGVGSDLYQLSVFRRTGMRPFSPSDMTQFSGLANFVVASAVKHDMFRQAAAGIPRHLDLDAIEHLLQYVPGSLSKREVQVCARVIAGMTIDRTALDLAIKRTSVVTYRQRAYEKLNISRQNELVALVNNLRFDNTAGSQVA